VANSHGHISVYRNNPRWANIEVANSKVDGNSNLLLRCYPWRNFPDYRPQFKPWVKGWSLCPPCRPARAVATRRQARFLPLNIDPRITRAPIVIEDLICLGSPPLWFGWGQSQSNWPPSNVLFLGIIVSINFRFIGENKSHKKRVLQIYFVEYDNPPNKYKS